MEWIKETMEKSGKNTVEQTTINKIKKLMQSKFGIFIPLSTPIYMQFYGWVVDKMLKISWD